MHTAAKTSIRCDATPVTSPLRGSLKCASGVEQTGPLADEQTGHDR
jgi:hypothetical protein